MKFYSDIFCVLAVDLLATSGDITLSWTSPMYPKLYSNDSSINPLGRPITEQEDAWIGSLLNMAAVVGSFPFSFIAERFGRKIGLLSIAIPHILSFITLALARNIYCFYVARILGGLAVGGGYAVLPMYIAEISKDSNRGAMGQTLTVFWAVGNFLPYALGPFMSIFCFNMILTCIPTLFFVLFLMIGQESPYYLMKKNKTEKAEATLMKLRNVKDKAVIKDEIYYIKSHIKIDDSGTFLDIVNNKVLLKTFLICTILIMTQELSGYCAIIYHLQPIFEAAGTKIASNISALIVGTAILLSSFISPFLVDRAGRRCLVICSCFGMCTALVSLGTFFYILDSTGISTKSIYWLPVVSLIVYIFSFNFGICCVPYTLVSELFPSNVKHIAASTIACITWSTSSVTTGFFNSLNDLIGRSGTFWIFAGFCLFTGIFSIITVPETKGKSFVEIQEMLNDQKKNENEVMLKVEIKR